MTTGPSFALTVKQAEFLSWSPNLDLCRLEWCPIPQSLKMKPYLEMASADRTGQCEVIPEESVCSHMLTEAEPGHLVLPEESKVFKVSGHNQKLNKNSGQLPLRAALPTP